MPIKVYKPTSPGRREMSVSTFEETTRDNPERSLLAPLKKKSGVIIKAALLFGIVVVVINGDIVLLTLNGINMVSRLQSALSSMTPTGVPASLWWFMAMGKNDIFWLLMG